MEVFLIVIFMGVMALSLLGKKRKPYLPPGSSLPDPTIFKYYERKESLFVNRSELAFFHALTRAVPPAFFVLTKPRLEDVIGVKKNLGDAKLGFALRGRVKSRHIDFLVIDDQGRPRIAVELDGRSHKNKKALAGDVLKDGIFAAVNLPLRRVIVGEDFAKVAFEIAQGLNP